MTEMESVYYAVCAECLNTDQGNSALEVAMPGLDG
jgi:hypothetical protein